MAHIVKFSISGLAGNSNIVSAELDRQVNIFHGPNGCGKTSLLRILDSAMANSPSTISTVPFEHAEVTIYSVDYKRTFTRTITKSKLDNDGSSEVRGASLRHMARQIALAFDPESDQDSKEMTFHSAMLESQKQDKWETHGLDEKLEGGFHHQFLPTFRNINRRLEMDIEGRVLDTQGDRLSRLRRMDYSEWERLFAHNINQLWLRYSLRTLKKWKRFSERGLRRYW